jgi:hypothetical protein
MTTAGYNAATTKDADRFEVADELHFQAFENINI